MTNQINDILSWTLTLKGLLTSFAQSSWKLWNMFTGESWAEIHKIYKYMHVHDAMSSTNDIQS